MSIVAFKIENNRERIVNLKKNKSKSKKKEEEGRIIHQELKRNKDTPDSIHSKYIHLYMLEREKRAKEVKSIANVLLLLKKYYI